MLGGTGPQGRGLGLRLALAGHRVALGSRDAQRAAGTAKTLRDDHGVEVDRLTGVANDEAAAADIVIVAVPFDGIRPTLAPIRDMLAGSVLVSCVNRLGFDGDGPFPVPIEEGSAAELIARLVPEAEVVGAFHHVPARRLSTDTDPVDMDVLITGDDAHACALICDLADAIPGVRGILVGPLRLTRPLEELTAVVLAVNRRNKVAAGVRLAGLPNPRR